MQTCDATRRRLHFTSRPREQGDRQELGWLAQPGRTGLACWAGLAASGLTPDDYYWAIGLDSGRTGFGRPGPTSSLSFAGSTHRSEGTVVLHVSRYTRRIGYDNIVDTVSATNSSMLHSGTRAISCALRRYAPLSGIAGGYTSGAGWESGREEELGNKGEDGRGEGGSEAKEKSASRGDRTGQRCTTNTCCPTFIMWRLRMSAWGSKNVSLQCVARLGNAPSGVGVKEAERWVVFGTRDCIALSIRSWGGQHPVVEVERSLLRRKQNRIGYR